MLLSVVAWPTFRVFARTVKPVLLKAPALLRNPVPVIVRLLFRTVRPELLK